MAEARPLLVALLQVSQAVARAEGRPAGVGVLEVWDRLRDTRPVAVGELQHAKLLAQQPRAVVGLTPVQHQRRGRCTRRRKEQAALGPRTECARRDQRREVEWLRQPTVEQAIELRPLCVFAVALPQVRDDLAAAVDSDLRRAVVQEREQQPPARRDDLTFTPGAPYDSCRP